MSHTHFQALDKNQANFVPLSPLSFIRRTASLYPERRSIVYADREFTWQQTYKRCCQFANALQLRGVGLGDTVSILCPNTPALIEAQFAVPMAGAVINTINTRLDVKTLGYILQHADARLLMVDAELLPRVQQAQESAGLSIDTVVINDPQAGIEVSDFDEYEDFIATGSADFDWQFPADEWQALALNYTSGTSGNPKGVVYHHRGSYLMSMGSTIAWKMPVHPVYLYTVPLFHCNGWGYAWTVCLLAGTLVCIRQINAADIFRLIEQQGITHFGGAPIVLSMLVNATDDEKRTIKNRVQVMTAGAPPPPTVLRATEAMNFEVMQVYGLTETYGHVAHCLWKSKWDDLNADEKAEIKSWQGMSFPMNEQIALFDRDDGNFIPVDCHEQEGEICIRGNTVMKGYYKDPEATAKAFDNGWFHSGDIAVWQDIGYLQMRDRLKDIIISGGENIASVEVEKVLYRHPSVAHAAVVAQSDEKWGEVPAAYIELKPDEEEPTTDELTQLCRQHLAGFKVPKHFYFRELPKTATGKIQKFLLRQPS